MALAATLVPIVILAGWNDVDEESRGSIKGYFALILVLETLMIGVFVATDVFLFYVFFEVMLIPVYFMIGRYGGVQRSYAAVKFLLYSLVGGLFMLASLIGLYVVSAQITGTGTFDFLTLAGLDIDPDVQKMLFLGFFFAFAIKAPLWPFHTWLPDAAAESKPGTSVLLIGVLDKVGTFGMIRYCLEIFPDASSFYAPVVIGMALIGIFYGAFVALSQNDMKRLFAYSSMSHFGFITLGIFVFTSTGPERVGRLHGRPRAVDGRALPHRGLPHEPLPRVEPDLGLRGREQDRTGAGRLLPHRGAVVAGPARGWCRSSASSSSCWERSSATCGSVRWRRSASSSRPPTSCGSTRGR